MIVSRSSRAAGGVRPLLLAVLLGLFCMHVLTAHGGGHHDVVTATTVGGPGPAMSHHGAESASGPGAAMTGSHPGEPVTLGHHTAAAAGVEATASPGRQLDGAGLALCWLLLTAGVALLALLLLSGRSGRLATRLLAPMSTADPRRPRAPPGRLRLLELVVLRV